ncbi:FtsK/SpoIIIE family DNA translocase [Spirosoma sp. KUDC1026]|uniref:FtsK/SpoIIIE family DNA translocase n=1 Tax=Spirosoma sp. KUDC1026 TaxID=2745947 RepID=UPI00159BC110|nr:DNA translocase FtsK [Spirosoma sp. KUDC1026]QKZ15598.1 DNA translocase FtsK 4TM domain-containing protein [Spirosoma sp. KUDC1026]
MAQPTTSPRQNTLRQPATERPRGNSPRTNRDTQSPPPRAPKPSSDWAINFNRIRSDQRSSLILGVLFMGLGVGLLIAFVSYLLHGPADQSVVGAALTEPLAESGTETRNLLGLVGASVAHVFVFRWFGVGALALPFIPFLAGYKLTLQRELLPLNRTTMGLIFTAVWTSLLLGYIVLVTDSAETGSVWCGGIGYEINVALHSLFGWGNLAIILFLLFIFLVYFADIRSWKLPKFSVAKRPRFSPEADSTLQTYDETYDETEEDVTPADRYADPEDEDDDTPIVPRTTAPINQFIRHDVDPEPEPFVEPPVSEPEPPVTVYPGPTPNAVPTAVKSNGVTLTIKNRDADDDVAVAPAEPVDVTPTFDVDLPDDNDLVAQHGLYDSTLDLPQYQPPTTDLLTDYQNNRKAQVSDDELTANKEKIETTLRNFGIEIDSIQASIGPTVTLYEIIPAKGVRISKIKGLVDDIALSLSALGIRIIAPMPGMGTIGIEVPNKNREMVSMRSVITSDVFANSKFDLPVVLGKTISNEIFIADLAKMPHLLMAGATGQGKSVGLNVLLTSLIYKKHPSQLKLVLVDPKKVELTLFNKLERHFLAKLPDADEPIITDTKKVVNTLNSLCIEMDNRYNLLKDAGCRNLKEYNAKFVKRQLNPEKGHKYLPYIVLIIDELADLMMTAGKEVEQPIARLAQLARAIGIHLVVATQRPSVNVITGLIKANFPARLSFKVTSKIDSRTILDTGGAEQLVGMGDMLLSSNSDLIRLQCPFVDTNEIEDLCDFVGGQRGYEDAYHLPEFVGDDGGQSEEKDVDLDNRDPMFDEAARLIVIHQQGSTSLIQRKLKLGYNRAGRLIDQLEAARIVGPFEGSKARDVLVNDLQTLEEILKQL